MQRHWKPEPEEPYGIDRSPAQARRRGCQALPGPAAPSGWAPAKLGLSEATGTTSRRGKRPAVSGPGWPGLARGSLSFQWQFTQAAGQGRRRGRGAAVGPQPGPGPAVQAAQAAGRLGASRSESNLSAEPESQYCCPGCGSRANFRAKSSTPGRCRTWGRAPGSAQVLIMMELGRTLGPRRFPGPPGTRSGSVIGTLYPGTGPVWQCPSQQ